MLRTTVNSLTKTPAWRSPAVYSSVRNYSTPVPDEKEKKPSLSQRLGGTGRGKVMESASDPFASFLANAKKPRNNNNNNNNRNGNFTPRPRKQTSAEGQFADAPEPSKQTHQQQQHSSQNRQNRNRQNNNNNSKAQKAASGEKTPRDNNNNSNNNNNNRRNRNNNAQNGGKKLNLRRSQPQEIRTRRATTFIDKDIDWSSFNTTAFEETESVTVEKDSDELVLKDMQGDYDRYLGIGSDLKWPSTVQASAAATLIGTNPSFDLQQKTAFLAALSSATNGNAASVRK